MKMKSKRPNIPTIIFIFVLIVGVSIMLYPVLISSINAERENKIIKEYSDKVKELREANYNYLFEEARKYNQSLTNDNIVDAFSKDNYEENEEYNKLLNINNDGVIGYIKIPKIDVNIPIYHGTNTKVLERGIGHFEKSSLPVGGDGTHSILSGHRGLPSSRLFSDLNQLQDGDLFYIYVLDQILAYKVDKISIVEPDDIENLKMEEGKDYVTLVTCTPYAINTHRLLVRGTRITYNEEEFKSIKTNKKLSTSDITLIGGLVTVAIIIISSTVIIKKIKIYNKTHPIVKKEKKNRFKKAKKQTDMEIAFPKLKDK